MSDRPWWLTALQWVAWFAAMMLVTSWLARARKAAMRSGNTLILVHPPTTLIVGVIAVAFFGIIAIVSGSSVGMEEWWAVVVFGFFGLVGAATLGEGLRVRHELSDTGITYQGLLRRYDLIPWNEIVSARWSPGMKWLVVTASDSRVMRFSGLLNGLDSLAVALAERVPALEVDEETARMLADAREGRLPNVW